MHLRRSWLRTAAHCRAQHTSQCPFCSFCPGPSFWQCCHSHLLPGLLAAAAAMSMTSMLHAMAQCSAGPSALQSAPWEASALVLSFNNTVAAECMFIILHPSHNMA